MSKRPLWFVGLLICVVNTKIRFRIAYIIYAKKEKGAARECERNWRQWPFSKRRSATKTQRKRTRFLRTCCRRDGDANRKKRNRNRGCRRGVMTKRSLWFVGLLICVVNTKIRFRNAYIIYAKKEKGAARECERNWRQWPFSKRRSATKTQRKRTRFLRTCCRRDGDANRKKRNRNRGCRRGVMTKRSLWFVVLMCW